MQRWFATFPDGWPGIGLLLLRLTLAGGLFAHALPRLHSSAMGQMLPAAAEILIGLLLIAGVWTPVAGVIAGLLQLGLAFTTDGAIDPALERGAVGLCIALLGPGAWSIDARLFGRRRVEIKKLGDH